MTNKWCVKIYWGEGAWRFFLNLINKGVKINEEGGGILQNSLILVINEKRDIINIDAQ